SPWHSQLTFRDRSPHSCSDLSASSLSLRCRSRVVKEESCRLLARGTCCAPNQPAPSWCSRDDRDDAVDPPLNHTDDEFLSHLPRMPTSSDFRALPGGWE